MTLDKLIKESKQRADERKKHELETKEKMERVLLNIQSHAGHQAANELAQSLNQTQNTIALHVSTHAPEPKGPLGRRTGIAPVGQSSSYVVKRNMPELRIQSPLTRENSLCKKPKPETTEKVGTPQLGMLDKDLSLDESITFSGAARIACRPEAQRMAFDDSYGKPRRLGQTAVGPMYQEEPVLSIEQKMLDANFDFGGYDDPPGLTKQVSAFPDSNEQASEDG